ncbi:hypothetical protein [Paenibacillus sp. CF384]|uniref:hypothetical protein n=1 Tax=Paenibacillus sp. CF384 TaxID=1884382 RepID=UPI00089AC812|nr:hypothetical protein [Paenibacillus sp. CF384]SDW99522.1 hypothetical protein SAMN05518855_1007214 [Paenibacillus sp. CF384]
MPYTTGPVTNTRDFGTASTNIVISTRNLDMTNPATIIAEIFASVDSSIFYTAYHLSYVVPPNSYDVREFFIAGNVTYEVQLNTMNVSPPDVILAVTGLNEFGNLVEEQLFNQNELILISAMSPPMV